MIARFEKLNSVLTARCLVVVFLYIYFRYHRALGGLPKLVFTRFSLSKSFSNHFRLFWQHFQI